MRPGTGTILESLGELELELGCGYLRSRRNSWPKKRRLSCHFTG